MKIVVVLSLVALVMQGTGVTGNQEDCSFPFRFGGKTYRNCTYTDHYRPWCAWDNEYKTLRWSNCECSATEARKFNCSKKEVCVPAAEGKAARCVRIPLYSERR